MRCRGGASSADPPVTNIDEVAIATTCRYPADMLQRTLPAGFIAPCLPTKTDRLPSGSGWLHEIKHGHCPQEGHAGEALQPSHALVCSATAKFIKRATPREASAYRDLTSRPR